MSCGISFERGNIVVMLRKTKYSDLEIVEKILKDGKKFLKEQNVNQRQHGSPSIEDIKNDIKEKTAFVYELENKVVATLKLANYDLDYEKSTLWSTSEKYLALHRFAVLKSVRKKGVAKQILFSIIEYAKNNNIKNIKVDTHKDNIIMRRFLLNFGFKELGEITLSMKNNLDDKKRIAYEFKLEK